VLSFSVLSPEVTLRWGRECPGEVLASDDEDRLRRVSEVTLSRCGQVALDLRNCWRYDPKSNPGVQSKLQPPELLSLGRTGSPFAAVPPDVPRSRARIGADFTNLFALNATNIIGPSMSFPPRCYYCRRSIRSPFAAEARAANRRKSQNVQRTHASLGSYLEMGVRSQTMSRATITSKVF